jgi:hypothetical protein
MKRTLFYALVSAALVTATAPLLAAELEPGFTPLCDGKTFDGWKPSEVNQDSWKIEDGAFVTRGKTFTCSMWATRSPSRTSISKSM